MRQGNVVFVSLVVVVLFGTMLWWDSAAAEGVVMRVRPSASRNVMRVEGEVRREGGGGKVGG